MNTQRENTHTEARPVADQVLDTIIRGEDVLEEAREVAQRISGRVQQAVTFCTPPGEHQSDRQ